MARITAGLVAAISLLVWQTSATEVVLAQSRAPAAKTPEALTPPPLRWSSVADLDAWIAEHIRRGPESELLYADTEIVIIVDESAHALLDGHLRSRVRIEYLVPLGSRWRSALIETTTHCPTETRRTTTTRFEGQNLSGASRRGEPPLSERQRYILSGAVHDCEEASARPIDAVANAGEAPSPSAADPISRKAWADSAVDLDGWTAPLFDEFQLISLSEEIERTNGGQISIRVRTELYEPRYIAPWAHGLADRKVDFLTRSQLMTFEVDCTRHLARLTELRNYPRRNLKGSPARGYSGGYQGTPAPFSDARLPPALFQRACARAAST